MSYIILLNGHPGAGKSTIAQELRLHIPRLAIIDVDLFRKFISDYNNSPRDIFLMWEVVRTVVEVYLKNDISVLVDRCIDKEEDRLALKELSTKYKVPFQEIILYTDTLACAVERVDNRPAKKLSKYKKNKINEELIASLREIMLRYKQDKNIISIDTENNSVQQATERIVNILNNMPGE